MNRREFLLYTCKMLLRLTGPALSQANRADVRPEPALNRSEAVSPHALGCRKSAEDTVATSITKAMKQAADKPSGATITLFMCGDVMTGRGIDQIMPHPSDPRTYEPYIRNAIGYVKLVERAHGLIPKPVDFSYIWGYAHELDFGHFCLHLILILCNSLILLKVSFLSLNRELLIYKEWPKSSGNGAV